MRWSLVLLGVVVLPAACGAPSSSVATRTQTTPGMAPVTCAGCHRAEVDEWQSSMHHASFSSADFQRSYRVEHHEYCANCHAPLRTAAGGRDEAAGIGCLACHSVDEGHATSPTGSRVATKDCQACHDFDVPGTYAVLQSTGREHAVSPFSTTPCKGCHMPSRGQGRRDHRFRASRDPELLRRALRVQSARIEDGAVVVLLASQQIGHRFPTGDLYRRLTVTLTAVDERGALIAGDTFHLSRDWDNHRASLRSGTVEAFDADTRLTDAPREFRIACQRPPARVRLTVDYERGASAEGEFFEAFETLEILDDDLALHGLR